ncbi:twinfilin [Diabrotica virgifera virgifera]|uniref:Twinfilin n=1 Tax=Diabrotica virgifera virgifera TaxID=50390 RepID=A0A6P7G1W4_DIAVI|nr:twinfilin [Diabrotica virgifera virgifera]
MSHQTGIRANDELKKFFAKCKEGMVRLVKVSIKDEQLVLDASSSVKHNWEKDFDTNIQPLLEENQPCYIIYRLDTKDSLGHEWLLISWSPDTAPVRQKMLYASTKATLKQEFGTAQIKEEIHGTVSSDITLNGYIRHKKSVAAPAPLSMREEELQELRKTEVHTEINIATKQQTAGGVAFPITETAKQALIDMASGSYDYLQFRIDIEEEIIHLVSAENISLAKLPSKVPKDSGRYHLYKFKHTHEGDYTESMVFIYSMPGYNCPIKERMLYSSCKNPLTDTISNLGIEIAKKVEIDSGDELTEKFLYDELHPTNSLHRPQFARPKGPPNRGPKRMTRNNNE